MSDWMAEQSKSIVEPPADSPHEHFKVPPLTPIGKEALLRRLLAGVLEVQSVLYEANGYSDKAPPEVLCSDSASIIGDLAHLGHRVRERIGA